MLDVFLKGIDPDKFNLEEGYSKSQWGRNIAFFNGDESIFDDSEFDLAILGVKEDRSGKGNTGAALAPDEIRKHLYSLYVKDQRLRLIDLGNIEPGEQVKDTYAAVAHVIGEMLEKRIVTIVLGGSHDITYAQYLGYKNSGRLINMVMFDERIDLREITNGIDSENYLLKILLESPNYLFNFSHIGFQTYYVENRALETLEKLNFDCVRLGEIRKSMEGTEPMVRDADMVSFDLSAIRFADSPAHRQSSPNGFTGEEACQITRYAGLSDKLSTIGFYELNPEFDSQEVSGQLLAQMVWYFVDGFYGRRKDNPQENIQEYMRYIVKLKSEDFELTFLRSKKTERWWMELPANNNGEEKTPRYTKPRLVPCSYSDYQMACNNELPDRWMKAYQKMI